MKHLLVLFSFSLTILTCLAANTVSVFVDGSLTETQRQIVNSAFTARLSSSKDYTLFERNEMIINALTREQDYQVSGEVPESQIRKVASRYGVDYVVAVHVVTDESNVFITARLIDIETGKVLKTINQDRTGSISNKMIKNMSNNVSYRLVDKNSK